MATVACPGCGLPRVESELDTKPCPVCASAPAAPAVPRAKPKPKDPTDGLPADASELYAPDAPSPIRAAGYSHGGSKLVFGAVAFLLGALCGVGGVLGVQALDRSEAKPNEPEVAAKQAETPALSLALGPRLPEVAPMPHEPTPKPVEPELDPDPELGPNVKQIKPPLPGHVETHEFNEPMDVYSVPVLKKGEHVVLKGKEKVRALRVHGLDAGAVLDASDLDAAVITVTGRIDNGAKLKLNALNGTVHISGKIDNKSEVTITAPGGEVKFMVATTPTRDGSKIDNGSTVAVTARVIEFKGDITGTDTRVSIVLTRNAWLKVAQVNGRAVVEYKSQVAAWSPPDVIVGPVAPGATFRKTE
jgi:hypothetical protein